MHRSKCDDQSPPCAAGLEPSVCLARPLRGVSPGHSQREYASLGQLPETIELLELAIIGAHERGCEFDATLRRALEAAHRRKCAAVPDCRNDQFVQHSTVGETVNA